MHRARAITIVAATAGVLAAAAPAAAFHHVNVPGSECGEGPWAGGNNPTARAAIVAHNPAQTLPLPPGPNTGSASAPAFQNCAGAED